MKYIILFTSVLLLVNSQFLPNLTKSTNNFKYTNQNSVNPFDQTTHDYAVNPHYVEEIKNSKTLSDTQKQQLQNIAAAFWIDTLSAIQDKQNNLKNYLDTALAQQQSTGRKQAIVFIVYDLPNRDCAASASNGEICCDGNAPDASTGKCSDASYNSGDCSKGLALYKNYIDTLYNLLLNYQSLELIALIEPDSLPNMVTNLGSLPHCTTTTQQSYIEGIKYALTKLSGLSISMYIDMAHGGWLGWCGTHPCSQDNECNGLKCFNKICQCDPNQAQNGQKFVQLIKSIFDSVGATVVQKVRGFATNTANYQPLGYPADEDPCQLSTQYNFAGNELRYINQMDSIFKAFGISKSFITDTGRNGIPNVRSNPTQCQQWCNIKGGLGFKPTSDLSKIQPLVSAQLDALFWLKTPGESDGCSPGSGQSCVRVDQMCQRDCSSSYQKCPSPEAGAWDDDMIKILADNATPSYIEIQELE